MGETDLDKKLAKIREDVAELVEKAHKDIKKAKREGDPALVPVDDGCLLVLLV